MLNIYVDPATKSLQIPITGMKVFWSYKKSFFVSLDHIKLPVVIFSKEHKTLLWGWNYGMFMPGVLVAGTFWSWGLSTKTFFYMGKTERAIVIETTGDEDYKFLILGVEEGKTPEEVIAEITKAVENAKNHDA